jgi:signal transduction histidine kinase/ActR/RegA family two-component response regulator
VELASFSRFSATHQAFLDQLTESIGLVLNTIEANTITENLLKQSQSQAQELQSRQEDLRASNEDLAKQASRLADQNIEVEAKNQEVQSAKRLVEEKAEQLAVSSAFKSEFFANMSHELRTPLNSLLILAGELKANPEKNLTEDQVHYASIIQSSGTDLLRLLNDVLDLAKMESGTATLEISELPLMELHDALEREFRHVADQQGVSFAVELAPGTAPVIATDPGRLRQVLKNLLTNAFKFTENGEVTLRISRPDGNWRPANGTFESTRDVTAFSITDTGVGIAPEQQEIIFEAFAQADGSTARQYGGTGLGLSISRELVGLLGGEMTLNSTFGEGSTFTVYLPSGLGADGHATVAAAVAAPEDTAWPDAGEPFIPPASPQPDSDDDPATELAGKKVLVVDDDFRNIFAITVLLERGEIEVVSAESGEEGIAALERMTDIDLVLMDIMMPVMDGYATMRAIRKSLPDRPLAIVALTAKTGAGERQRCLDAGATAYISKPVENGPDFLVSLSACLVDAERPGSGVPA